MKLSTKAGIIAALGVLSFSLVVGWSLSRLLYQDLHTENFANIGAEVQIGRQLAETELELFSSELLKLLSEELRIRKTQSKEDNRFLQTSDFVQIALFSKPSDSKWEPVWTQWRAVYSQQWSQEERDQLLLGIPREHLGSFKNFIYRLEGPGGLPFFALLVPLKGEGDSSSLVGVGVLSSAAFSKISMPFKNLDREAIFIDGQGYALAYTNQQYVGASLTNHPLISRLLKEKKDSQQGTEKNLRGEEVFYSYEKLEGSNLYFLVTSKKDYFLGSQKQVYFHSLLFGAAFALILGGLMMLLLKDRRPVEAVPLPVEAPTENNKKWLEENKPLFRLEAYRELGAGLAQALKGPLTAILGHTQKARSQTMSEELKENFTIIEREARKSHETVTNLLKMAGVEFGEKKQIDLQSTVLAVLAQLRGEISRYNIRVVKNFHSSNLVLAGPGQLEAVLESLLQNAIESMANSKERELHVEIIDRGNFVRLRISDSGVGMSEDVLARAYDPFFTTKQVKDRDGLGLTIVKGVLSSLGGSIHIESQENKGSTVLLDLPLSQSLQAREDNMEKPSAKAAAAFIEGIDENLRLLGFDEEQLPTAPASDEITFVGESKTAEVSKEPEGDFTIMAPAPAPVTSFSVEGIDVSIRKPKVRAKT